MIRACWGIGPHPGNAGDMVTPWLLNANGLKFRRLTRDEGPKHLMCGSIAIWARPGDTLWGTGNSHASLKGKVPTDIKVLAVRGPLTREILLEAEVECPAVYGDPALLMPKFFTPKVEKQHKLGIIPHYVDDRQPRFKDEHTISVRTSWANLPGFVNRVCQCERIISSSLHGLIIAHAYGIPARWVEFSDKVFGKGLKFRDYLLSVGHVPYEPVWPAAEDWRPPDLDIDLDLLWSVRPWA